VRFPKDLSEVGELRSTKGSKAIMVTF
jgi:hypothetical protein